MIRQRMMHSHSGRPAISRLTTMMPDSAMEAPALRSLPPQTSRGQAAADDGVGDDLLQQVLQVGGRQELVRRHNSEQRKQRDQHTERETARRVAALKSLKPPLPAVFILLGITFLLRSVQALAGMLSVGAGLPSSLLYPAAR